MKEKTNCSFLKAYVSVTSYELTVRAKLVFKVLEIASVLGIHDPTTDNLLA